MKIDKNTLLLAGAGLGVFLFFSRGVGKAVGEAVGSAATGAVVGIGKSVGIPETNMTQCEIDLANGDYWAASFSCPASTFVQGVLSPVETGKVETGKVETGKVDVDYAMEKIYELPPII